MADGMSFAIGGTGGIAPGGIGMFLEICGLAMFVPHIL
jgi:hypothetical protein